MAALIIASYITPCPSAFLFTTSVQVTGDEATEDDVYYANVRHGTLSLYLDVSTSFY